MEAVRSGPIRSSLRLLFVLSWSSAAVAGVEFEPGVTVGVSYTDNLALSDINPQSATVYQLLPGFSLTQKSKRFQTDLDYAAEAYRYDELGETEVYQNYGGELVAQIDPDNFLLTLGTTRQQTVRDAGRSIPLTNLPITANRVDRDESFVEPSFAYGVGGDRSARGSFRRGRVSYDEDNRIGLLNDFDTDSLTLSLDNYAKERGLTWAVRYVYDETDFQVFRPWEYRQAGIELGTWVSPRFRVFATGGKESPWDEPFNSSLEDSFWEVGFATPGDRNFSVEIATGERTFGSSGRVTLKARFPHGSTELHYGEEPTTQGREAGDLAVSSLVPGGLNDFLNGPGAGQRYISKLLSWSLSFDLRRTSAAISIFDESREQRTAITGNPLADEGQSGVDLSATWLAGPYTHVSFAIRKGNVDLEPIEYRIESISLGATHQLGRKTAVALLLSRIAEDSDVELGAAPDYTTNQITLTLSRTF